MQIPTATAVWERLSYDSEAMSRRAFVMLLTFWVAAGIGVSATCAVISLDWQLSWQLFVGTIIVTIAGVLISGASRHPALSLLGYAMIVVPFGLMTGPVVAHYTTASVFKVLAVTGGMVVGLGIVGAIWPRSLQHWGVWLFGMLLALLLGMVVTMVAGAFGINVQGATHFWDWAAIALFSGFVIFDLNRAMQVERTHNNALHCAVAIYLDFINIFYHLLSLFGTPAKKD